MDGSDRREDFRSASRVSTVPRRILIVDDNRDAADSLASLLQMDGHATHLAYNGLDGLEAAKLLLPEVVLLDIGMPNFDGYAICRRIREEPWGKDVVLVALSGYGQPTDIETAHAAGFNHYLLKPVSHENLAKALMGLTSKDDRLSLRQ